MHEKLAVAVVGLGWGEVHVKHFLAREDVEVVAVCARRQESANRIGELYDIPLRTTSYEEVLALDRLDIVSIATPPYLHHDQAIGAIERGCHVLCEKPLAMNAAESAAMLDAAERGGVVHGTYYEYRLLPNFQRFHQLLADGFLGEFRHATMHWMSAWSADPKMTWSFRNSRELGGYGILGDISHFMDDLNWHFGPISSLVAELRTWVPERPDKQGRPRPNELEDGVAWIATSANGGQVCGHISRCAPKVGYRFIECFGTEGMLKLTMPAELDELNTTLEGAHGDEKSPIDLSVPTVEAEVETIEDRFVSAIRDRSVPVVASFAEGLAAMELADAMRESSESRDWVSVGGAAPASSPARS